MFYLVRADTFQGARFNRQVQILVKKIRQRNSMRVIFGIFVESKAFVIKQENQQDCQIAFQVLVFGENEGAAKHDEEEVFRQNFAPNQVILMQHD
jgi:hypothetical protein